MDLLVDGWSRSGFLTLTPQSPAFMRQGGSVARGQAVSD